MGKKIPRRKQEKPLKLNAWFIKATTMWEVDHGGTFKN
jgi:hypothetical protein